MIFIYLWIFFLTPNTTGIDLALIDLLTNGSHKTWYLASEAPEEAVLSCQPGSPQSMDNTYTFYADGRFEFSNGEITEDPSCIKAGCCSDLVSFIGTWEFINERQVLKIFAVHKTGDLDYLINEVLFEANIDVLEIDKLILSKAEKLLEFNPK